MVSIKYLIKLFLPPIIIKLKNLIFVRQQTIMKLTSSIGEVQINGVTLVVIGNGPSLLQSLKENEQILMQKDSLVVNHFCETEYYAQIKPKYYLLADPAYWGDLETYADWLKTKITRFIETFIAQTSWDINLIIPSSAYQSQFVDEVSKNPYIHIYYYNIDNCLSAQLSKYELWDSNLIAPPAQTVLNTAVWLGIFLRYKNIYMIGADTTWIENLHVDQETNEVYTIDSHFYGEKKIPLYADVEGKIPQKLHDELNCISRALSQYWDLKGYADYAGVKVFNASKYSLIDAFERKKNII